LQIRDLSRLQAAPQHRQGQRDEHAERRETRDDEERLVE
jgi:hypothetical protein